ncbi:unnamed protein product [Porites lobata]|uniref:Synaptosomal-associated protein 47 n=1 Tax=Porites lobata TaxID=104759 RepID=A0ABN8QGU6_9CNID|nr:unnamed protein product [Porites lobata]
MGKIGVWKASYYCNKTKTWIYGRLVIYTRCIRFVEEKEGRNCVDFRIYYDDFFELKKETTSIFYAAISVRVNTDKYWFSSFSDRGYVFNTIEHFWKERLFASSDGEEPPNSKLLNILYDAQSTLTSVGKIVHKQGQQIDAACSNTNKIHNDLSVAETLIYNLDSWLNKWNVETPHVHIDVPENNAMVKKSEFPIVYARTQKEKHLPGSLVLSNESVDILTAERNFDISFTLREITEISVHTPWEMTILQLRIGQTGQSVHLIAARLVHILQTLEVMLPGKVNYEDPPGEFEEDAEEKLDGLDLQDNIDDASADRGDFQFNSSTAKNSKAVRDAEAAEMGQVLQGMRSLALGIQDEQNRQLRQLDLLSDSVDKANERVRTDSRKISKLT